MTSIDDSDLILLRVNEIFLKQRNRNIFFRALVRNARRLVADLEGVHVDALHLRVVVRHPPALRNAVMQRLHRLFGMSSMSPTVGAEESLESMSERAVEIAKGFAPGTTFRIATRRRHKRFPMTSPEISAAVGAAVIEATGLPVDIHTPQQTIHIEIAPERTFVYSEVVRGPGGLPVGTSANVTLLLSGGIDSPVAAWSMMRRGCNVNGVYFHSHPYTSDKTKEKVLDLAKILARWQGKFALHIVHFTEVQKALRDHCRGDLAVLVYRRMMMRVADMVADHNACAALVTGENIAQVASQTVENMAVIEEAARLPVFRPLLCLDKEDIIEKARAIGTFETSILPYEDACSLFVPKHPATRARIKDAVQTEEGLDLHAMASALFENIERIVVEP